MIVLIIALYLACIYGCGIFWHKGGQGQSLWRNPGVPTLIATTKLILLYVVSISWWNLLALLYIPAMWGMIQGISYGVSSPPHKLWVWIIGILNGKYNNTAWKDMADKGQIPGIEIATRSTCGFFWSLPATIFAFYSGAWILFSMYVIFNTIVIGLIGGLVADVKLSEESIGKCVGLAPII